MDLRLRGALLTPLCALAVHQLRYYLAFGPHAPSRLQQEGHAYLSSLEPLLLLGLALAMGGLAGALARAAQTHSDAARTHPWHPAPRAWPVWAICALTLLALYCGQELFEGLLAPGHPAGLAGVLGHGGWIAMPAALVIGTGLAATLKLSQALVRHVARKRAGASDRAPASAPPPPRRRHLSSADWRLDPQSGLVAGLAPPRAPSLA